MDERKKKNREFVVAYDAHSDALFRFCYFKVSNRELAVDLVQETFTKAWGAIVKGQEVDNVKSFLYKIANNLVIDEYRKRKNVSLDSLRTEGFDVADQHHSTAVTDAESKMALLVIDKLEDKYKEVVTLRFVSDLSPKEIAEVLGETENAVSVRINRAMKQMRELFNGNE